MMLFVLLNSTSVVVKVKRVSVKSPLTFLQFINLAVVYMVLILRKVAG